MTRDEYKRFLQSAYWNKVRGLLMYQRGGKCERCGSTRWLQAHHTKEAYKYIRHELNHMNLLELLCVECHKKETEKNKKSKKRTIKSVLRKWLVG